MPPAVLNKKYKECTTERWLESKYMSAWVRGRARQNIGNDLNAPHPYKPAYLFETGIEPWTDFPVAGVIWYQGESDAEIQDEKQNAQLLTDMIKGWRKELNNATLPFLMVELPRINDKSPLRAYWPEFRHVQQMVAAELPKVYSLTTLDLGSKNSDVHPPRKLEVGTRLADLAAATQYGVAVPYSGPVAGKTTAKGDSITVHYQFAEGLTTTNGQDPVGFEVSANGKQYHPATARIEGETVVLTSDKVKKPKYARYGWYTYMEPNLINGAELPATPYSPEK
jgi:sialate O-acetylesterase